MRRARSGSAGSGRGKHLDLGSGVAGFRASFALDRYALTGGNVARAARLRLRPATEHDFGLIGPLHRSRLAPGRRGEGSARSLWPAASTDFTTPTVPRAGARSEIANRLRGDAGFRSAVTRHPHNLPTFTSLNVPAAALGPKPFVKVVLASVLTVTLRAFRAAPRRRNHEGLRCLVDRLHHSLGGRSLALRLAAGGQAEGSAIAATIAIVIGTRIENLPTVRYARH